MSTAWLQNKEQRAPASAEADRSKDKETSTERMSDKILIVPDQTVRLFLKIDSECYSRIRHRLLATEATGSLREETTRKSFGHLWKLHSSTNGRASR
jgi:hypothetical protein